MVRKPFYIVDWRYHNYGIIIIIETDEDDSKSWSKKLIAEYVLN